MFIYELCLRRHKMAKSTSTTVSTAKPVAAVKPAQDAQAEATKRLVAQFAALELPVLATGSPLTTYQQDLISVGKVQAQKEGREDWWILHSSIKGDEVAKIPQSQLRALLFVVLSFLVSPRTDRGYAYIQWAATNKKLLEQHLGSYTVKVSMPKSTLPIIVGKVSEFLATVEVRAKILRDSVALQAPVKSVGTKHQ